jgi:hypothetical protein
MEMLVVGNTLVLKLGYGFNEPRTCASNSTRFHLPNDMAVQML